MQTSNAAAQRRNNLAVLARAVWKEPGVSRRELVERFAIDESSISRLVGLLIGLGLVEEFQAPEDAAPRGTQGGRPRRSLRVKPDFGMVWGLTLWRDRVRVAVLDVQGRPLAASERHVPPFTGDWKAYLSRALLIARETAASLPAPLPLLGLGFGVPGWIDSDRGVIIDSREFNLLDAACPHPWEETLPVLWENDANCGAWSSLDHEDSGEDELLVLGRFLENGPLGLPTELSVGYGLVVGGRLHRGWRHKAGEFRSALWSPPNRILFGVDEAVFGRSRDDPAAFRATTGELLRNLIPASQLLDPRWIGIGGDLKTRFAELLEVCESIGWIEGLPLLRPLPAEVDEVSTGAALLVLDELFGRVGGPRHVLYGRHADESEESVWRGVDPAALY
ncbi:MAG: ROK family protein [Spirochaetia bacterium]|nr:ROK family protein [Spirochaetia bacterium]